MINPLNGYTDKKSVLGDFMKAYVVPERCISCGLCIGMCGSVFDFNEDGKSEAVGEVTSDNAEDAKAAARGCPTEAIIIE